MKGDVLMLIKKIKEKWTDYRRKRFSNKRKGPLEVELISEETIELHTLYRANVHYDIEKLIEQNEKDGKLDVEQFHLDLYNTLHEQTSDPKFEPINKAIADLWYKALKKCPDGVTHK